MKVTLSKDTNNINLNISLADTFCDGLKLKCALFNAVSKLHSYGMPRLQSSCRLFPAFVTEKDHDKITWVVSNDLLIKIINIYADLGSKLMPLIMMLSNLADDAVVASKTVEAMITAAKSNKSNKAA